MSHQTNKQFNSYKEGLDLEFLREYCMEHGERRVMERGETLEEACEPAQWVAFVERGVLAIIMEQALSSDGIIGASFFRDQHISLNYRTKTLCVY